MNIIESLLPYVGIYFSARLIDALTAKAPLNIVIIHVILTVGITFSLIRLKNIFSYINSKEKPVFYSDEEWGFSDKTMKMDYAKLEDKENAALLNRIDNEKMTGLSIYRTYWILSCFIKSITQIIASIGLTYLFFSLKAIPLTFKTALMVGIVFTVILGYFVSKKTADIQYNFFEYIVESNIRANKMMDYIEDYGNGKDIRLYNMQDMLWNENEKYEKDIQTADIKANIKSGLLLIPQNFFNDLLKYGCYIVLIMGALSGNISVGRIAQYVASLMLMITAIREFIVTAQEIFVNTPYLKNYFAYLDTSDEMYRGTLTVEKKDDNEYEIEFRDVSFKYPNTNIYSVKNVNFKFKIGEKLAIVGKNGSGKTTFIKLLCRLYDPTDGEILLNGVNIKKYDYEEYMSIFSVVFQDFQLTAMPIAQNVAFSKHYDENCLEKAGFTDKLKTLTDGIDTYIGKYFSERGVELSGGELQKNRITIILL